MIHKAKWSRFVIYKENDFEIAEVGKTLLLKEKSVNILRSILWKHFLTLLTNKTDIQKQEVLRNETIIKEKRVRISVSKM